MVTYIANYLGTHYQHILNINKLKVNFWKIYISKSILESNHANRCADTINVFGLS